MIESADLSFSKIFVTGIFGSGKSTAAVGISQITGKPYKPFDKNWNYKRKDRLHATQKLAILGDQFVTDAIAFSSPPDPYFSFTQFYDAHPGKILILCMTCLDIDEWLKRLKSKPFAPAPDVARSNYVDFHNANIPLHDGKNVLHYDTDSKSYVSYSDILKYIESIS